MALLNNVKDKFSTTTRNGLLLLMGGYRTILTTQLGGACRFYPSCSEYAVEALKGLPLMFALKLIVKRVLSCRPGGGFGFDPVPEYVHPTENGSVCRDSARYGKCIC